MSAHTPGPWKWVEGYSLQPVDGSRGHVATIINTEGCTIKRDAPLEEWQAELVANMELMEAAPDLLAALQEFIAVDELMNTEGVNADRSDAARKAAHAAVNKALGK